MYIGHYLWIAVENGPLTDGVNDPLADVGSDPMGDVENDPLALSANQRVRSREARIRF
jgi:hypothetical protein